MKLCGSCYSTSCCTKRFTELVGFRPKWITLYRKRKLKLSSSTSRTLLFLGTLGTLHWETFCQVRACLTCMLARKQVSSLSSFLSTPCPLPVRLPVLLPVILPVYSLSPLCHPPVFSLLSFLSTTCAVILPVLSSFPAPPYHQVLSPPCHLSCLLPMSSLPSFLSTPCLLPVILHVNFMSPSSHPSCLLYPPVIFPVPSILPVPPLSSFLPTFPFPFKEPSLNRKKLFQCLGTEKGVSVLMWPMLLKSQ